MCACCIGTDEGSDQSSGRDTPASGSSRQGAGDNEENKKDKKKKAKGKKKDKLKSKGKEKEKKKSEEGGDELDKKTKKKGFGLLRQDPSSLCLYFLLSVPLLFLLCCFVCLLKGQFTQKNSFLTLMFFQTRMTFFCGT